MTKSEQERALSEILSIAKELLEGQGYLVMTPEQVEEFEKEFRDMAIRVVGSVLPKEEPERGHHPED